MIAFLNNPSPISLSLVMLVHTPTTLLVPQLVPLVIVAPIPEDTQILAVTVQEANTHPLVNQNALNVKVGNTPTPQLQLLVPRVELEVTPVLRVKLHA